MRVVSVVAIVAVVVLNKQPQQPRLPHSPTAGNCNLQALALLLAEEVNNVNFKVICVFFEGLYQKLDCNPLSCSQCFPLDLPIIFSTVLIELK